MWGKALVTAVLVSVVAPAPAYAAEPQMSAAVLMSQVVTRTNQLRHRYGCDQLVVDHDLIDASLRQSYDMAASGRFSHIGRDGSTFVARAHAAGYARPSGENIAWGFGTAAQTVRAWMASPPHRANMLNCGARSIGTGVAYAGDGTPYYTELFGWE